MKDAELRKVLDNSGLIHATDDGIIRRRQWFESFDYDRVRLLEKKMTSVLKQLGVEFAQVEVPGSPPEPRLIEKEDH